jgi:pimeloyl-ACP methyl ester carboxylesterase
MLRRTHLVLVCFFLFPSLALPAQAEDRFFDSNGVKIHCTDEGKGEPVLLIHGFSVNAQMNWDSPGIIHALAQDYRVIALDNRGHGKSDKPHDPKQYGQQMVEDAVRLLDHRKIQKAHVVGYSMGGMITAKLLATHPDRLLSATLGGHGGMREGADSTLLDQLAKDLDEGKGIGRLMTALTPPGRAKMSEEQLGKFNKIWSLGNDQKALAAVVRSFKELAVPDEKLKSCTVPTLALIGSMDPLKKGVDDLPERLPGVKVVVIEGADHMTAVQYPLFISALKEFLASHHAAAQ